jgi:large subunit ribosomal protein L10
LKKSEKQELINWLKTEFEGAPAVVLADFRGLTVARMNSLRAKCREAGVQFKVIKNTLAGKAFSPARPRRPGTGKTRGPRPGC